MQGDDSYVSTPATGLTTIVAKNLSGPALVIHTTAIGTLYLCPFSLAAFVENAGTTNSFTIRGESHGGFVVQRADAVVEVEDGSS